MMRVAGSITPAAPVDLGELMTAGMIHAEFYAHLPKAPSVRWVAQQMPRESAQRVGKSLAWWRADVLAVVQPVRQARAS